MFHLPTELVDRIVGPKKRLDESFMDFFRRVFPVMCVNRRALRLYHHRVYETLYIELNPDEDDPIIRQYLHMARCEKATAEVKSLCISGLINNDVEGPVQHDLHAADLAAVLRLAPNIHSLSIKHLDLLPTDGPTPPVLPIEDKPLPEGIINLHMHWIRFSHPDSFDQIRFLAPNIVDIRISQIYWTIPFPARALIHDDVGPTTAQIIDIFPDYPPMAFRYFQLTVSAWMGSIAFGAGLTKLHLGSHDNLAVLPELLDLWETIQFEAMPVLRTVTFSISLRSLHSQACSTLFAATLARIIIRSPRGLSTIYITLLTDDLLGTYPDEPLSSDEWFLIRTACAIHGDIAAVIVTFVDDGPTTPDHAPTNHINPIEHAFFDSDIVLLYVCTNRNLWNTKVLCQ